MWEELFVIIQSKTRCVAIATSLVLVSASAPAAAQEAGSADASLVDSVTGCLNVAAEDARLACFDRNAKALEAARRDGGLVVMDRSEVREKRRSLFGFQLPRVNLFGRGEDVPEEEVTEINSVIRSSSPSGRDRWVFTLEDGSQWTTLVAVRIEPNVGEKVRIRAASLGSYLGSIGGRGGVRVRRIE